MDELNSTVELQDRVIKDGEISYLTSSRCSSPSPPFELIPPVLFNK
jgi:hypothetical protein